MENQHDINKMPALEIIKALNNVNNIPQVIINYILRIHYYKNNSDLTINYSRQELLDVFHNTPIKNKLKEIKLTNVFIPNLNFFSIDNKTYPEFYAKLTSIEDNTENIAIPSLILNLKNLKSYKPILISKNYHDNVVLLRSNESNRTICVKNCSLEIHTEDAIKSQTYEIYPRPRKYIIRIRKLSPNLKPKIVDLGISSSGHCTLVSLKKNTKKHLTLIKSFFATFSFLENPKIYYNEVDTSFKHIHPLNHDGTYWIAVCPKGSVYVIETTPNNKIKTYKQKFTDPENDSNTYFVHNITVNRNYLMELALLATKTSIVDDEQTKKRGIYHLCFNKKLNGGKKTFRQIGKHVKVETDSDIFNFDKNNNNVLIGKIHNEDNNVFNYTSVSTELSWEKMAKRLDNKKFEK